MKKFSACALLICILLFPASVRAEIRLNNGVITYQTANENRSLTLGDNPALKVDNTSNLVFVPVDDPSLLNAAGKSSPALFFFDGSGLLAAVYSGSEGFEPELCQAASLGPGGKIIALDNGTWQLRIWTFLNFPEMTPASEFEAPYLPYFSSEKQMNLAWVDPDTVLVTDVSEIPVSRPCPADPCEPFDVIIHKIKEWNTTALAKGTELCNYNLESYGKRTATVRKTCAKSIDEWGDTSAKLTVRQEKIQIPAK